MILETLSTKSRDNELPFNAIKSFGKIKFKKESSMVPGFEVEGVDNLLSNNDIRSYVSALDKSCLSWMNNVEEVVLEPVI